MVQNKKDDYTTELFIKAVGQHSSGQRAEIAFDTGIYYVEDVSPSEPDFIPGDTRVVENWDDSTFLSYQKRLAQALFDYIKVTLIDGTDQEIKDKEEVEKFNQLGEKKYLHHHNLSVYRILTSRNIELQCK